MLLREVPSGTRNLESPGAYRCLRLWEDPTRCSGDRLPRNREVSIGIGPLLEKTPHPLPYVGELESAGG